MNISGVLREAYLDYLQSGDHVELPQYQHRADDLSLVYASDLGRCPLAAALKRTRQPERFPKTDAERLTSLHLMRQGVKDAEPLQEALVWAFGKNAEVEKQVEDRILGVRGRIDTLLHREDGVHILEFKRRDTPHGGQAPEPKLSDCFQVMAYGEIMKTPHMHIVTISRYFVTTWTLDLRGTHYWVVNDETGEQWGNNNMDIAGLKAEIARQKSYLDGNRADPMPGFANHPDGWQCGKPVYGKGVTKTRAKGQWKTGCEHWCHSNENGTFDYTVDGEGNAHVELPLTF